MLFIALSAAVLGAALVLSARPRDPIITETSTLPLAQAPPSSLFSLLAAGGLSSAENAVFAESKDNIDLGQAVEAKDGDKCCDFPDNEDDFIECIVANSCHRCPNLFCYPDIELPPKPLCYEDKKNAAEYTKCLEDLVCERIGLCDRGIWAMDRCPNPPWALWRQSVSH